ncbi:MULTISPECIES: recombinase family protein [Nocardia]|uniref:recombinase family protein n=1 Tax=Nocardia TaxID=1817 RepID=UPI003CC7CF0A
MIGYGRVSTAEQNPDHQIDALHRAGVATDDIHIDTASGAKASRPQLDLVLKIAREDDTIVVTRLDRLGRSVLHPVTLGAQLRERGIGLWVIEQGIDTDTRRRPRHVRHALRARRVPARAHRRQHPRRPRRARGASAADARNSTVARAETAQWLYDEQQHTVQQIADILGVKRFTLYGHLRKTAAH